MAAFTASSMTLIGQGNGNNVYLYTTDDTIAEVATAAYFNSFRTQLSKGDLVLVAGNVDGTPTADVIVMNNVASGDITVVNGT
jgi:hypothetical protein